MNGLANPLAHPSIIWDRVWSFWLAHPRISVFAACVVVLSFVIVSFRAPIQSLFSKAGRKPGNSGGVPRLPIERIGLVILLFVFFASFIGSQGCRWYYLQSSIPEPPTPPANTQKSFFDAGDRARLTYETRTMLGLAEATVFAAVSIFLPFLVGLWNSTRDKLTKTLEGLVHCRPNAEALGIDETNLETAIKHATEDLEYLTTVARKLRPLFYFTIAGALLLLLSLGYANFAVWSPLELYTRIVLLGGAAVLLVLWLSMLLVVQVIFIQPLLGRDRLLHAFGFIE